MNNAIGADFGHEAGPIKGSRERVLDGQKSAWRTRRTLGPVFKARVALVALREDKRTAELCKEIELHPTQIVEWKRQLLGGAADVFGAGTQASARVDLAPLHAEIGRRRRRSGRQNVSSFEHVFGVGHLLR